LPDLDLAILLMWIGAAPDPLDRLRKRLALQDPVTGDQLLIEVSKVRIKPRLHPVSGLKPLKFLCGPLQFIQREHGDHLTVYKHPTAGRHRRVYHTTFNSSSQPRTSTPLSDEDT
jgi:hypothetical protein